MEAIVILLIVGGYLTLAIFAVRGVVRWAGRNGYTKGQRWLWGTGVALVFYLVPFWDWVPTVVAHQYFCATEAKFEVRKTLEQWKTENTKIIANLRHDRDAKIVKAGPYYRYPLNQRLASERIDPHEVFLTIKRTEGRIVDIENGEVLASYVDFVASGNDKFWLRTGRCRGESRGTGSFMAIEQAIVRLGGGK
jgi:hypothetical protein